MSRLVARPFSRFCLAASILVVIGITFYGRSATARQTATEARKRVERLTGAEAKAYLENVWNRDAKRKAAHLKAVALLQSRGYKPTDIVVVVRRLSASPPAPIATRLLSWFFPAVAAQTYQTGDGDVWFSSWDDGDDSTWEGELGGNDYQYGNYADGAAQYYMQGDQVNWADGYIDMARSSYAAGYGRQFFTRIVGACGTAAGGCWWSGAAFGQCMAAWCGVGGLGGCSAYILANLAADWLCASYRFAC